MNQSLPGPEGLPTLDHSAKEEIPYYQWVPIILAFMLLVFAIPSKLLEFYIKILFCVLLAVYNYLFNNK